MDVTPAVGDAVNVHVDSDARFTAGDAEHEVGALGADAVKSEQYRRVAGQRISNSAAAYRAIAWSCRAFA